MRGELKSGVPSPYRILVLRVDVDVALEKVNIEVVLLQILKNREVQ
jgi:hypothetical protein